MQMKIASVFLIALASAGARAARTPRVFLGEAYPSGAVYLQAFDEEGGEIAPIASWPKSVTLYCQRSAGCADATVGSAPRVAEREATVSVYPPSAEHMDNRLDESCLWKTQLDAKLKYADGEDFFEQMSDQCDLGLGFAKYKTKNPPKGRAYGVVAIADDLKIEAATPEPKDGVLRPASAAEKKQIAKEKKELKGQDCTTEPTFLDQARVRWTAKEPGTTRTWRLSSYTSPGCGGHLGTVYLLDVLKDGKVVSTHTLIRPKGLL